MKLTGSAILALAALAGLGFVLMRYGPGLLTKTLNPASPDNIANQGANAIVAAVTGDANQTVGGAVFDTLHTGAGLAPGEKLVAPGLIAPAPPAASGPAVTPDGDIWGAPLTPDMMVAFGA